MKPYTYRVSRRFVYYTPRMIVDEVERRTGKRPNRSTVEKACRRAGFRRPRQPREPWVLSPRQTEKVISLLHFRVGNPKWRHDGYSRRFLRHVRSLLWVLERRLQQLQPPPESDPAPQEGAATSPPPA